MDPAERYLSASSAAMAPEPADVIAWTLLTGSAPATFQAISGFDEECVRGFMGFLAGLFLK